MSALIGIFILLATVFGSQAWRYSGPDAGTKKDADFWWLLQGSTMQILGIPSIVFPLLESSILPSQPRRWALFLASASLVCTIAAIPLYLLRIRSNILELNSCL